MRLDGMARERIQWEGSARLAIDAALGLPTAASDECGAAGGAMVRRRPGFDDAARNAMGEEGDEQSGEPATNYHGRAETGVSYRGRSLPGTVTAGTL